MNITKFLNQTGVRWEFSGHDGYGGGTYASSPEEISCRCSDYLANYVTRGGEEEKAMTTVLTETAMAINDWFYLGELSDVLDQYFANGDFYANGAIYAKGVSDGYDTPENIDGAYRVNQVAKITWIDGTVIGYKSFLTTAKR